MSQSRERLFAPHVDSFNYFLGPGIRAAVNNIQKDFVVGPNDERLTFWWEDPMIMKPTKSGSGYKDNRLFPKTCRESKTSYTGAFSAQLCVQINDNEPTKLHRRIGNLPIMVKSSRCQLHNFNAKQLVLRGEEETEAGGYFVINGLEKLIRLVIAYRKNYPMAVVRGAYSKRGTRYTNFGIQMRCVRDDQSARTVILHYLNDGTSMFSFNIRRQQFFVSVGFLMKALVDVSDKQIHDDVLVGEEENTFFVSCVEQILLQSHSFGCFTRASVLAYIGQRFRTACRWPPWYTDQQCGEDLLKEFILVHLNTNKEKYQMLVLMLRKLLYLASGRLNREMEDSPEYHEVLLPGHLILNIVKEQMTLWLAQFRKTIEKHLSDYPSENVTDPAVWKKCADKTPNPICKRVEYLLSTGNVVTDSGLDLQQISGFSIQAERLNFLRFISHFRSVHRGHFFTEMKTTEVRKLLPQSWGFVCPVHTPDGSPCGLLNHLAARCEIVQAKADTDLIPRTLVGLGMSPAAEDPHITADSAPVLIDGRIVGFLPKEKLGEVAHQLRYLRVSQPHIVDPTVEIACFPHTQHFSYPMIFIQSTPARYMRPVRFRPTGAETFIGSLEQSSLDIACLPADVTDQTVFEELSPTSMLSVVASLTPFSDYNQSPRNLYQCQMGKQTMGIPTHALPYRHDGKSYRMTHPQKPVVRCQAQETYSMNDYPTGTNACVAVISYTGFDMEDAMIINKSAYERGFGHACIYMTKEISLEEESGRKTRGKAEYRRLNSQFCNIDLSGNVIEPRLDIDGLPKVGTYINEGDPLCAFLGEDGKPHVKFHKGQEGGTVEAVTLVTTHTADPSAKPDLVRIRLRVNRNPVIGDKFSSRHGQKGVLSVLWQQTDMPFTESGITPDCIINPHAFPSRMTIGMMIESMAGKAGGAHGIFQDSTPFEFNRNKGTPMGEDEKTLIDYVGEQLAKAGFNYQGSEPMYSGVSGELLRADIFFGSVYYQRLRHMVSDKYQVRTTGPINPLTHQPIKGRKLGGGIRLGEMERDSLLAHGVSFLLQDRLMHCSDETEAYMCQKCGSLVSVIANPRSSAEQTSSLSRSCRACGTGEFVGKVRVPYVLLYLINELSCMNLKLIIKASSYAQALEDD
ncbi:putative DNA-directed RNA polymerase I subunit RPA2 [Blattamonas nauphoetae]|uniref:DNA-directed RNA polymerase subunit beta n=1 Tax=Blattamonas nauphoetae TaxID=2049346 RepID=A0ABQ9YKK1_9EUKA|nr:putative DNA-directed RNA polymerase I subunit RPA2 [Blattamonas nauphoetae]